MPHTQFDNLIQKIASQSPYNKKVLLAVCLLYLCGGVLVITVSLTVPIIKQQYNIQGTMLFMIACINQIGQMLGGSITPSYFKNYSRKTVILWSFSASVIMSIILSFGPPLFFIYLIRFLIGISMGVFVSQIPCVITEVSAFDKRGYNFGIAFFVWPLGGILPTWTFKHFNSQQAINLSYIITGLITIAVTYYYLPESPKQLVEIKEYSKSLQAIKFMKRLAGLDSSLTEAEFQASQQFIKFMGTKQSTQKKIGILQLFSPELLKKTLIVALQFTVFFAIYNYIIFCLPELLMVYYNNDKPSVQRVTYMCLISQSIAYLAAAKIVQTPRFGKKWTMIYCGIGCFISSLLLCFGFQMISCLVVCNLFLGVALTAIYPMTSEMYTIQYRLEIISLGVIFNQLVPSFITLLVGSVEGISLKTPFIFIAVALIPTIYYLTELPDDKTQVGLDEGLL